MSLIVARVTPRGVWLTSDMRITDPSAAIAPGFLGAALKVILISPTLCIGYAGSVGGALTAIERVDAESMTVSAAIEFLGSVHRGNSSTEFIVAGLRPPLLVEIKDGRSERREAAWIGDAGAYNRYQALYHGDHFLAPGADLDAVYKADLDIAVAMNDAMQELVIANGEPDGPGFSDALVGEASVTVGPNVPDGAFSYHVYATHIGPFAYSSPTGGPLPSTERGTLTLSFMAPEEPGVGAIGLYFREGQFGLIYAPLMTKHADRADRIQAANAAEFVARVKERYGITLSGVDDWGPFQSAE
jgi:hypothetical protein